MNCASCPRALLLIPLALACFELSPQARATCQDACLTNNNTVQGDDALISLTTGIHNTAIGAQALHSNTSGIENTATGFDALNLNTSGSENTAIGVNALQINTTGKDNTAVGFAALKDNTVGNFNTAIGFDALLNVTTASDNTAVGDSALPSDTTGTGNAALGDSALFNNTTGDGNTAIGTGALAGNINGHDNIGVGLLAGEKPVTGSHNIYIGNAGGGADESGHIRIGKVGTQAATFIAGISGATAPDGVGVIIGANGKLGTVVSSARFKDEIKPMDKASEAILALKPVTFRYKHDLDPAGIPQFGLVAEQVEKVNPDLVARDEQGKPYTVRYEAVNAMLLNEFLKEHKAFVEERHKVQQLEATAVRQQKQIEALTAGLQKVSAQCEMSKSAPKQVVTNQ